jgi:hypothetical protein
MANAGTIPITPADGGLERPLDRGRSRGRALLCGPGPYLPAGERVGAQPAPLHQAARQPGPREPFEVRARLAAPLAEALYPRPGSASRPGRPARYPSRRGSASAGASPTPPAASSSRASASTKMNSYPPPPGARESPDLAPVADASQPATASAEDATVMGLSASAASAISSTTPGPSGPARRIVLRQHERGLKDGLRVPSVSAAGSNTTPGDTPKNTAQVATPRPRTRKRPGHPKPSGKATGTGPSLRRASRRRRPAPASPGTSDESTPSTSATQPASEAASWSTTGAE